MKEPRRTPHGPFVNLNGASRESLIEQHRRVLDAAGDLLKALGDAFPHGRDYQTAPALQHRLDQQVWEDNMTVINNLRKDYEKIAVRLTNEQLDEELRRARAK
jgi:hypothetical protein